MTYILGFKFGHSAYVIADSALTVKKPTNDTRAAAGRMSSFGQLNVYETERAVFEGALKMINLGQIAVAFCGDVPVARSVIETLFTSLRAGLSPRDGFERALSSTAPFDPNRPIHLIASIPASPDPILLAFNIDGDRVLHDIPDGTLVQFGGTPPMWKHLSADTLRGLHRLFETTPAHLLACTLAVVQSYGIHDNLFEHGVGGAFLGLRSGTDCIQWQDDILFVLHDDLLTDLRFISSIVRDNVHVVRSNITNSCNYFGDTVNGGLDAKWRRRWWDAAFNVTEKGKFDFVSFLNIAAPIVTVVEMKRKRKGAYLQMHVTKGMSVGEAFRCHCAINPLLTADATERLYDDRDGSLLFRFNWFPFDSPPQDAHWFLLPSDT